jgi:hypothetical protein
MEAMVESGKHHFEECRAGMARACVARALERARAAHQEDEASVKVSRISELEGEFARMNNIANRVDGRSFGRIFDSSLLCPLVPLPPI